MRTLRLGRTSNSLLQRKKASRKFQRWRQKVTISERVVSGNFDMTIWRSGFAPMSQYYWPLIRLNVNAAERQKRWREGGPTFDVLGGVALDFDDDPLCRYSMAPTAHMITINTQTGQWRDSPTNKVTYHVIFRLDLALTLPVNRHEKCARYAETPSVNNGPSDASSSCFFCDKGVMGAVEVADKALSPVVDAMKGCCSFPRCESFTPSGLRGCLSLF